MNTKHLEYMLEIAKCQSISKAAKKLYLPQPSLSASITALEEEIGVPLFQRSQSGVTLTERGKQILEVAVEILRGVEQIQAIAKQEVRLTGQIHIATISATCDGLLEELFAQSKMRHPQLNIVTEQAWPRQILQKVAKGESNLGIMVMLQEKISAYDKLFKEKNICFLPLFEDRLSLFVAAEHPYALRSSVTDDEIRQTAITCFNRECYLPMLSGDFLKMQSMEDTSQHISYSFDDLENIKKVAVSGLAAAILPRRRGMQDEVIRQHLVPVEIAKKNTGFIIGVLHRNSMLSAAEKWVVELLHELIG